MKELSLLLGLLAATGCASGSTLLLGQPVHDDIAVLVRVSDVVGASDDAGGTEAIVAGEARQALPASRPAVLHSQCRRA